ncbi:hypothetical protein BKA93DRAFT_737846 [Sparassis latifolia]
MPIRRVSEQVENWDDDFRDNTDSPVRRLSHQRQDAQEAENWDADFEEDRHGQSPPRKGSRQDTWASSDEEDDYRFADREEDRTVTSRTRGAPLTIPDIPPVPPLPSPFPRSPTVSVFSVPPSSHGHDAYSYSSTAPLALRPTISGGSSAFALLPPSPPIHRERRRLRKKSRPTPHTNDIFELDDRAENSVPRPLPPSQPSTPEKKPSPGLPSPDDSSADHHPSTSTLLKTPLLSRIGSVGKKWSTARKKRASTGPSEVTLSEQRAHEHDAPPRPPSQLASSPPSAKSSWFFRSGGAGPGPGSPPAHTSALKHESSMDRLLSLAGLDRVPQTPSRKRDERAAGSLPRELRSAANGNEVPSAMLFGGARRPVSMQVTNSASSSSSWGSRGSRPPVPRHASYGRSMVKRPATADSRSSSKARSVSASASASVEDLDVNEMPARISEGKKDGIQAKGKGKEKETEKHQGSRSFMGGMRRLSLVGSNKHWRSKTLMQTPDRKEPHTPSSPKVRAFPDEDQTTPRPPSRVMRRSQDALLPPLELQPAAPLRLPPSVSAPASSTIESLFHPHPFLEASRSHPALSAKFTAEPPLSSPPPSPLASPPRPKVPSSPPQSASLGRAAQPPKEQANNNSMPPRRNSLGDLKIPARISQAQVSLRRDLGMVREFAASIEQLKQLQDTYNTLVGEVHELIESSQPAPSRAISPTFFSLPQPISRMRSSTNPTPIPQYNRRELSVAFQLIETKYQIPWECVELLIDLGSGAPVATISPTPSSQSVPPMTSPAATDPKKSRERAITLAGDESKPAVPLPADTSMSPIARPPSPAQWRASTGRHDLTQRQLLLLRELLNNPDSSTYMSAEPHISEEEIDRNWRWGDAMNSTVTLPSEESVQSGSGALNGKKRRLGMRKLRDILKSLKRSYSEQPPPLPPVPVSSTSILASTESSLDLPREHRSDYVQRRRARTSTGPESMKSSREQHPNSPYATSVSLKHRSSPRRPSLASIFRLGQKSKSSQSTGQSSDDLKHPSSGSEHASSLRVADEEEDWDRVEAISEMNHAGRAPSDGAATVRGKTHWSPYSQHHQEPFPGGSPSVSQTSLNVQPSPHRSAPAGHFHLLPTRSPKLSNVRELAEHGTPPEPRPSSRSTNHAPTPSPSARYRPFRSRMSGPSGSVRSAPPQVLAHHGPGIILGTLPESRLSMTPENIQPLLENAREVHARCSECIIELQALLTVNGGPAQSQMR